MITDLPLSFKTSIQEIIGYKSEIIFSKEDANDFNDAIRRDTLNYLLEGLKEEPTSMLASRIAANINPVKSRKGFTFLQANFKSFKRNNIKPDDKSGNSFFRFFNF